MDTQRHDVQGKSKLIAHKCPRCKSPQVSEVKDQDLGTVVYKYACESTLVLCGRGSSWEKDWQFECQQIALDPVPYKKYLPYKDDD